MVTAKEKAAEAKAAEEAEAKATAEAEDKAAEEAVDEAADAPDPPPEDVPGEDPGDMRAGASADDLTKWTADMANQIGITTGGTCDEVLAQCEKALGLGSMTGADMEQRVHAVAAKLESNLDEAESEEAE